MTSHDEYDTPGHGVLSTIVAAGCVTGCVFLFIFVHVTWQNAETYHPEIKARINSSYARAEKMQIIPYEPVICTSAQCYIVDFTNKINDVIHKKQCYYFSTKISGANTLNITIYRDGLAIQNSQPICDLERSFTNKSTRAGIFFLGIVWLYTSIAVLAFTWTALFYLLSDIIRCINVCVKYLNCCFNCCFTRTKAKKSIKQHSDPVRLTTPSNSKTELQGIIVG